MSLTLIFTGTIPFPTVWALKQINTVGALDLLEAVKLALNTFEVNHLLMTLNERLSKSNKCK